MPNRPLPDWLQVHRELRRPHVTLQLLHLEYRDRFPEGYEYSKFCRLYRLWQRRLDVVMRQEHRAGEKLFVDFAGRTIPIVNPVSGVITQADLFVAALGASTTCTPRRCPPRSCRTGSPPTSTPSSSWAWCRST